MQDNIEECGRNAEGQKEYRQSSQEQYDMLKCC